MYKDCKLSGENIEIVSDRTVKVLSENDRVSGLELKSGDVIKADGIFCLRDSVAMSTLLPDLKTNAGLIEVARDMSTNLPGVYAAGDCTGAPFQYAKSVGEGNVAAHSIIKYLSNSENE